MNKRFAQAQSQLATHKQSHLLRWWEQVSMPDRATLLDEIEMVPWAHVDPLLDSHVRHKPRESVPTNVQPAAVVSRAAAATDPQRGCAAIARGEKLLRAGGRPFDRPPRINPHARRHDRPGGRYSAASDS